MLFLISVRWREIAWWPIYATLEQWLPVQYIMSYAETSLYASPSHIALLVFNKDLALFLVWTSIFDEDGFHLITSHSSHKECSLFSTTLIRCIVFCKIKSFIQTLYMNKMLDQSKSCLDTNKIKHEKVKWQLVLVNTPSFLKPTLHCKPYCSTRGSEYATCRLVCEQ